MKNSFSLEIISTERNLTQEEQLDFRKQLRNLLKLEGVISMCLEKRELYIEYDPSKFNLFPFKQVLGSIGFPVSSLKLDVLHYSN